MNQIIVLDLDGTLLRSDKTVSRNTIQTLLNFKAEHNQILFATARPPRDAYKYIPEELREHPIICYNGACIIDCQKNVLYRKEIRRQDVLQIMKLAQKNGYDNICLEIDDTLFSNFDTSEFFGNVPTKIVDLAEKNFENAYKIIICSKIPLSPKLQAELSPLCKAVITDGGTLCQIMHKAVSKWNSIESYIQQKNIPAKNVIAFGDDYNDYEMLENAGIGVAMGNSEKQILKIADFVTDSNENEGVANFINKMRKEKIL